MGDVQFIGKISQQIDPFDLNPVPYPSEPISSYEKIREEIQDVDLTNESQDQTLIDIEALVLFRDHSRYEITNFLQAAKKVDEVEATSELDKLSELQIKIINRAIEMHDNYNAYKALRQVRMSNRAIKEYVEKDVETAKFLSGLEDAALQDKKEQEAQSLAHLGLRTPVKVTKYTRRS